MVFRIKHEKMSFLMLLIGLFILLCALSVFFIMSEMTFLYICTIILMCVVIALFFIEQIVRTVVTIEDDTLHIKHLFTKKTIALSDINDVYTERYKRHHKNHYIEKRMRMVITLSNGRKIILTDTAMESVGASGLMLRSSKELPDEEVTLYKVYQIINAKIH